MSDEIHSALWKATLLSKESSHFPRLVEAAAWRERKSFTDEMLRWVASNPDVLDAVHISSDEGVDAELIKHLSDAENATALDSRILAAVAAFVPESNEEKVMREMRTLNLQYLASTRAEPGGVWRQPQGAHDAYPKGWEVKHEGRDWISTVAANVWEPGVSGWREKAEEGDGPPEYLQPTGAHDAYNTGDQVTYEGTVYESTIDGNVWSPSAYPAGWKVVAG